MLKETYALSDEGVKTIRLGTLWTVIANLIVIAGMGIFFYLTADLLETLVFKAPLPNPVPYGVALVIFFAALWIAHWFQYTYTYGHTYRESGHQRIQVAELLRTLPLSFFGKRDLADLTETILTDVTTMEHVYSHVLPYLYGSAISTGLIALMLFIYDWRMALASLWSVPLAFVLIYLSKRVLAPMQRESRQVSLKLADKIQETLECVREIRSTNKEREACLEVNDLVDENERQMIRGELVCGLFVNSAQALMRLGIATTILEGTLLLASNSLDFMAFFGFLLVISRIYAPFDQAFFMLSELFMAKETAAPRLQALREEPVAAGSATFEPRSHDIVFDEVSFSYNPHSPSSAAEERDVLSQVSFTAKEGQVTALVGPSGSGKTTIAKLAARFWDPNQGTVSVGGVNTAAIDPETLLKDYSVVFQDVLLFDDTIMENIRLGRLGAADEEVLAAAAAANCDEFALKLPRGYHTPIGENGSKLSGGERQRISIARALLKDAPIVLLDEATASLDVENESQVQQALFRLLQDKTVLVIAHRMRTVMNADKIVVLDAGHIVEQGSPQELLAKEGLFSRMVKLQTDSASFSL